MDKTEKLNLIRETGVIAIMRAEKCRMDWQPVVLGPPRRVRPLPRREGSCAPAFALQRGALGMGDYLKCIDFWKHPITTSWRDRATFALPQIDIVQGHSYFGPEYDAAQYSMQDTDHLMRIFEECIERRHGTASRS